MQTEKPFAAVLVFTLSIYACESSSDTVAPTINPAGSDGGNTPAQRTFFYLGLIPGSDSLGAFRKTYPSGIEEPVAMPKELGDNVGIVQADFSSATRGFAMVYDSDGKRGDFLTYVPSSNSWKIDTSRDFAKAGIDLDTIGPGGRLSVATMRVTPTAVAFHFDGESIKAFTHWSDGADSPSNMTAEGAVLTSLKSTLTSDGTARVLVYGPPIRESSSVSYKVIAPSGVLPFSRSLGDEALDSRQEARKAFLAPLGGSDTVLVGFKSGLPLPEEELLLCDKVSCTRSADLSRLTNANDFTEKLPADGFGCSYPQLSRVCVTGKPFRSQGNKGPFTLYLVDGDAKRLLKLNVSNASIDRSNEARFYKTQPSRSTPGHLEVVLVEDDISQQYFVFDVELQTAAVTELPNADLFFPRLTFNFWEF